MSNIKSSLDNLKFDFNIESFPFWDDQVSAEYNSKARSVFSDATQRINGHLDFLKNNCSGLASEIDTICNNVAESEYTRQNIEKFHSEIEKI